MDNSYDKKLVSPYDLGHNDAEEAILDKMTDGYNDTSRDCKNLTGSNFSFNHHDQN